MNRRSWILGLASMAVGRVARADEKDLEAARDQAKKAGIGPLTTRTSAHYVAIGDAEGEYQKEALKLCEELASDFLSHFKAKKFEVSLPASKMVVVILKNPDEFAAFLGEKVGDEVGGIYDIDADRLVVFDNRARQAVGQLGRANTISLFHEATHQLAYNSGLLRRDGDVPACINEGLGVYGEVQRPGRKKKIGDLNVERLPVLKASNWLGASKLLGDDALFEGEMADQAYAQSWLFVYHLMKTPARLTQFRDYLRAIAPRKDASHRLEDAKAAFGDLEALDKELKKAAAKLKA